MSDPSYYRKKIPYWITGFLVLGVGAVGLFSWMEKEEPVEILVSPAKKGILAYENTFDRTEKALSLRKQTSLPGMKKETYYSRRQYQGSPPSIPHPIDDRFGFASSCLSCHGDGGFVAKFGKFAPVAPHPERINCTQCHVQKETVALFKGTSWPRFRPVGINDRAHFAGPPRIPHSFHERTNCLSCHGNAGGMVSIRTTHPERVNCRQCHVPVTTGEPFARLGEKP